MLWAGCACSHLSYAVDDHHVIVDAVNCRSIAAVLVKLTFGFCIAVLSPSSGK